MTTEYTENTEGNKKSKISVDRISARDVGLILKILATVFKIELSIQRISWS